MNVPNPVRASIVALSLMCIPVLAQNVPVKPAPAPTPSAAPAPAATVTVTPGATVTAEPAATVTAEPAAAAPAATPAAPDMAKVHTTMTENMASMEAADAAMKTHMDTMKAGMKSDMEMKHSMIAQMQVMADQIKELIDKVAALSAQLETPAKHVKASKPAEPKVRPPIILPNQTK